MSPILSCDLVLKRGTFFLYFCYFFRSRAFFKNVVKVPSFGTCESSFPWDLLKIPSELLLPPCSHGLSPSLNTYLLLSLLLNPVPLCPPLFPSVPLCPPYLEICLRCIHIEKRVATVTKQPTEILVSTIYASPNPF